MKIYGLTSTEPIVKKYKRGADGQIEKTPYPFVYEFTSTEYEIESVEDLAATVKLVSDNRGTLLKGILSNPLAGESRAGSTNPDSPTEWICLDLDGVQGVQTVDLFLAEIGLADVSYVLQWSSSMGIENHSGFRCHIFMLLDKPANPAMLKLWLMNLNLTSPTLISNLELTKTYNSIRWPLDVTTCQNDKLIYVSAPDLGEGIADPYDGSAGVQRISIQKRGKDKATIPEFVPSQSAIRDKTDAAINKLREAAGHEKRKPTKYKFSGETEYHSNPDTATITGTKIERGFVYLNLNGGDSWGYYHPEDNPAFIYNFKGEPTYRTADLLPQYWAKIAQRVKEYKPDTSGTIYLVFRDLHTSSYWNGTYNTKTNVLDIYKANSKDQLHDFMKQHGQPIGDYIPDWVMDFDPHNPQVIDAQRRIVNIYKASGILADQPRVQNSPPPTIDKLIRNFLGHDLATIEHFYNWLAVIAQKLDRTGTCWVLQGTQGTGKGMFFDKVIRPIFGDGNVVSKRVDEIESNFTSYFRNRFIIFIDEMEVIKADGAWSKVTAKLKNMIVEPKISVRAMYHEAVEVRNYANLIFSTNKIQGVQIDPDDRRYNVGEYQRTRLDSVLTDYEIDVQIPAEVRAFADYLRTRNADVAKARYPIDNAPRRRLQNIGLTAVDEVSLKIRQGDLEYFAGWIVDPETSGGMKKHAATRYNELLVDLLQSKRTWLTRDDLYILLGWLLDNVPQSPVKFASYIKHHDLELTPVHTPNGTVRAVKVSWSINETRRLQLLKELEDDTLRSI